MPKSKVRHVIAEYALKTARSDYVTESTFAKPGDLPAFISLPLSWKLDDQPETPEKAVCILMAGKFKLGYVWSMKGEWWWETNYPENNKIGANCATLVEAQNLLVAAILERS